MTKHSLMRAKERANLGRISAIKRFEKVLLVGHRPEEMPDKERKYLEDRTGTDSKAIYFEGYCYIFSNEGRCITMYQVPEWFGKKAYYCGKRYVKNPKRYYAKYEPKVFDMGVRYEC